MACLARMIMERGCNGWKGMIAALHPVPASPCSVDRNRRFRDSYSVLQQARPNLQVPRVSLVWKARASKAKKSGALSFNKTSWGDLGRAYQGLS
jgi:hypothetical protein